MCLTSNFLQFILIFGLIFGHANSCCCPMKWEYLNCGCNFFNCACDFAGDDFCYYENRIKKQGVDDHCRLVDEHPERCSAFWIKQSTYSVGVLCTGILTSF